MKKGFLKITTLISVLLLSLPVAASTQPWNSWLDEVRQEALEQGVAPQTLEKALSTVRKPSRRVKGLANSQPEKRLTYKKYRDTRVSNYRIVMGKKYYKKNKVLVDQIAEEYGVDPCFIMSFWGMETSYGNYMGDFPVINSLATLAYESNRKEFFRKQLFLALHILDEGHVSLSDYKGEWAGASGQPQFLPSSFVKYAVDYEGNGRKDIWKSKPDVFASIANYMKGHDWRTGEPWAIKVRLPRDFNMELEGKSIVKPVSEWNAMGVRTESGAKLPYQNLEASVIKPQGGPVFLAFPNYKMILRYNNSIYYAGAIGYLADSICERN